MVEFARNVTAVFEEGVGIEGWNLIDNNIAVNDGFIDEYDFRDPN